VNVAVRPFSDADRDFVEDLAGRTVGASVPAFRHVPEVVARLAVARLIDTVEGRAHAALIAESAGIRAGFVLLIEDLPDEISSMPQGFVAYMAVEPAYRRRGVGAALLEAAEDEARRRGLPYMTLMVTEENAAARALYERAGYFTERRLLCKAL
jgi:ribosomal protein S18 acetylase RimI-like enzyme